MYSDEESWNDEALKQKWIDRTEDNRVDFLLYNSHYSDQLLMTSWKVYEFVSSCFFFNYEILLVLT